MNEQATQDNNPNAQTILPAKRRRGRPRKDGGVAKRGNLQSPMMTPPAPENIKKVQQNAVEMNQKDGGIIGSNNVVGQMVSGVVDGCFDAGYFISVRVGNSGTTLRGLVFQPGRFAPITPANDVAPSAIMYHRNQVAQPNVAPGQHAISSKPMSSGPFVPNNNQFAPIMASQLGTIHEARCNSGSSLGEKSVLQPNQDQRVVQIQSHTTSLPVENLRMVEQNEVMQTNQDRLVQIHQSHTTIPVENLRMVEQDEVMQVFEVVNPSEGTTKMIAESILVEMKASEGTTSYQGPDKAQNQLMGSMYQSDILFQNNHNSSSGEIHHNPAADNQPTELASKNDKQPNPEKSYMQTLLQPGELVQCESKKLEIHRAPMNAQTQLHSSQGLPPMNAEIQMKEWTHSGQENQQNQFNQSTLFAELDSVGQETQAAAESQVVQPSNELKSPFLEQNYVQMTNENPNPRINQVLVTGETQAVTTESIRTTSMDFMMENLNYPKNEESQNTHIGPEVELSRNAEMSNETKEASELGDKLVLGSQLTPQHEEAKTENSDHSAKAETQNTSSDGGNINLEIFHQGQP
ncbi:uncharacterized protein LOC132054835 [Lycium ferocissimum]|uniref:uncharacterized protein LOC132054835 n=1 Tax=Lycium ferocissimum TaxID=112874 RepID=UPI002816418B|nr:uncharacterized protein LOC132054835 [Lycium ferocissimum]